MAFTVEEFRDLLRLLEQHADWKAELRRALLADDMLELPRIVRELAEAQKRTEARLDALTARVEALTSRVEALAEAQRRTEARLEALADAQQRTEQTVQRLVTEVGRLNGAELERRFRENAPAYLGRRFRRARVLSTQQLVDALEDALDEGRLSEARGEAVRRAILGADAVVQVRDPDGELWLVAEVSHVIDRNDVLRAKERAEALAGLGVRTLAGVAGVRFTEGAEELLAGGRVERWTLDA